MSVSSQNRTAFGEAIGASAALMTRFDRYRDLLVRWQKKINLVGTGTLDEIWSRHFLDSAQIWPHLPVGAASLADIGSGAGFPGLVLAVLASEQGGPAVNLVESDQRKAAFLREASRVTGAGAAIINARAEEIGEFGADIVTARACAPLTRLLPWVGALLNEGGTAYLLKGAAWRDELTAAEKDWTMEWAEIPSLTDTSGVILKLEGLTKIERHE